MDRNKFKKYWNWFRGILLFIVIVFLGYKFYLGALAMNKAASNEMQVRNFISPTDSACFSQQAWGNMKVLESHPLKMGFAVSFLSYYEENTLVLTEFENTKKGELLNNLLVFKRREIDRSVQTVYEIQELADFRFQFRSGEMIPLTNLYLNAAVDSVSTILYNDSTVAYEFASSKAAINYKEDGPVEFYIEPTDTLVDTNRQLGFAILKRQGRFYLLFVFRNKTGTEPLPRIMSALIRADQ